MQKLLIEVSHEDQIFVENECTNKGYTLSIFFKNMLEDYKNVKPTVPPKAEAKEELKEEPKKAKNKKA